MGCSEPRHSPVRPEGETEARPLDKPVLPRRDSHTPASDTSLSPKDSRSPEKTVAAEAAGGTRGYRSEPASPAFHFQSTLFQDSFTCTIFKIQLKIFPVNMNFIYSWPEWDLYLGQQKRAVCPRSLLYHSRGSLFSESSPHLEENSTFFVA